MSERLDATYDDIDFDNIAFVMPIFDWCSGDGFPHHVITSEHVDILVGGIFLCVSKCRSCSLMFRVSFYPPEVDPA